MCFYHNLVRRFGLAPVLVWLVLLLLLSGCVDSSAATLPTPPTATSGTWFDPPRALTNFELISHDGTPLALHDLHNQLVLMTFGYTHCPDFCPATLANFQRIKDELGADADEVAFVFVSVDGTRDTPEILKLYLERFDPDFIGLSGEEAVLETIEDEYGLYYQKNEVSGSKVGYLVDHSVNSYLIDSEGRLRVSYSYGTPDRVLVADIRTLLAGDLQTGG
ncbi:MAG: SCO family protein [Chloroflexaceae bacterium]|nr:SCO family protein [Chloroflexaceae bacterium]